MQDWPSALNGSFARTFRDRAWTRLACGHNRGAPLEAEPPPEAEPLALTVPQAGQLLGLSRNGSYEAAQRGDLPTIRIGARIIVPRRALDELLNSAVVNWRQRQKMEVA